MMEVFKGEALLRAELVEYAARLYDRRLITPQDGNLSVRLGDGTLLITPSGAFKANLTPAQILRIDAQGRVLAGSGQPSMEMRMHLAVYEERPDVRAVIHAHPPTAIALTLAGGTLDAPILPEVVMCFGTIPTARYATPGSARLAESIRAPIRTHDAVLLELHGALTAGKDLLDAFSKMERVEFVAEVTFRARLLGPLQALPADELARLNQLRKNLPGITTAPASGTRRRAPTAPTP